MDARTLILEHTHIGHVPMVPELRLYLADRLVPLWEASEWRAASAQEPPFWAFAWPGSQVLARWVLDHPELVRSKRVLDFGAGGGLAALAAARAGAADVVASDVDAVAAVVQQMNAALNELEVRSSTTDLIGTAPDLDVVLAGDVCYDRAQSPRITTWLRTLAAQGKTVFLADPSRAYAPSGEVDLVATFEVPTLRELESANSRTTRLLRVRA